MTKQLYQMLTIISTPVFTGNKTLLEFVNMN